MFSGKPDRLLTQHTNDSEGDENIGTTAGSEATSDFSVFGEKSQLYSQLQVAENRLQLVLEGLLAGVYSFKVFSNQDWHYTYFSPSCEAILGYSPAQLLEDRALLCSRIPRHEWEAMLESVFLSLFAQQVSQYEFQFQHSTGAWRWISATVYPQYEPDDQCWQVTVVATDVSQRKQIQAEMTQRNHRLQQQQQVMMELSQRPDLYTGDMASALRHITQTAAQTLQVERVGIWWLQHQGRELLCADLYCLSQQTYTLGEIFVLADYPSFQQVLTPQSGLISVDDVYQDRRTQELTQQYYPARSILSMMSVPIQADGQTLGVICCEQVDRQHHWQVEEQQFVIYLANLVSLLKAVYDRKAAELTLKLQEQELCTLVENSPDVMVRLDRQHRFLYVNSITATLAGISQKDFLGKTSAELGFSEELVALWNNAMTQVFTTGRETWLEYDVAVTKGLLSCHTRIVPEFAPNGDVSSVLVVSRDVSSLKRAQRLLQQQADREHTLRLLAQQIHETLELESILKIAVTEVQKILRADRTLILRLQGDRSGSVIQEAVQPHYFSTLGVQLHPSFLSADCYANYCQGKAEIITSHASHPSYNCWETVMQSLEVKSQMIAPIIKKHNGQAVSLWGLLITHACTEVRQWQLDELELLQQVAEQLTIAIHQSELHQEIHQWVTTLEQQVEERTDALQQALDFEAILRRITDKVRDSLDESQILEVVVQELGKVLRLECCDTGIYNADLTTSTICHEFTHLQSSLKGLTFDLQEATHADIYPSLLRGEVVQFCHYSSLSLCFDQGERAILACPIQDDQQVLGDLWLFRPARENFSDLEVNLVRQVASHCGIALRQSRLYQAAQTQVAELERLNHLKDDFLSTVSHELRTPMTKIKLATYMIEKRLETQHQQLLTDPFLQRYLKIIKDSIQQEIRLINDLLDLTHLESEPPKFEPQPIDLGEFLPALVQPFSAKTSQRQQSLGIELESSLPLLTTDRHYLSRILLELLENACKHTPQGQVIMFVVNPDQQGVRFQVSNSGAAISREEQSRIFEQFYRIPKYDPWQEGGMGLGLALVKKLSRRLRGTITVTSDSQWTTFTLYLPQWQPAWGSSPLGDESEMHSLTRSDLPKDAVE